MARQVLFIYNDPTAPEALLGEVFSEQGFDVDTFNVVATEDLDDPVRDIRFPDPLGYDVIVPLGSRFSMRDDALRRSWAGAEMEAVRRATAAGVGVLGVCFGGQLVADALGGTVELSPAPELGWYPVHSQVPFLASGPWFQWHSDRWTVPPGAVELAIEHEEYRPNTCSATIPEPAAGATEDMRVEVRCELRRLNVDVDALRARTDAERDAAVDRLRTLVAGFLEHVAVVG